MRRVLGWVVGVLLLPAVVASAAPPNIVLVIGDDHGWPDSGFMGHPFVRTPHLDALAAGGTVFRQAQSTASICGPSLRALLAGIPSADWEETRAAIESIVGPIPTREEVVYFRTLPRELARLGYLSWEGGSMWEGTFAQAGFTAGLADRIGGPFHSVGDDFGRRGWDPSACGDDAQARTACPALAPVRRFLDQTGGRPFLLWFAPKIPHTPFDAPASYRSLYAGRGLRRGEVGYYANVSWFDAVVGELVEELDARGLRENTLIVSLSDNGWQVGQGIAGKGKGKGTLHELGFRSPLVLHWPGHVPAGVVRDDLVSSLDVFPTVLDYAGAESLTDRPGRSIRHAVESGEPVGRDALVNHYRGAEPGLSGWIVRTPEWRYLRFEDGREELYRISVDPYEENDAAKDHPEQLASLRDVLATWSRDARVPPATLEAAGRLTDEEGTPIAGAGMRLRGRSSEGVRIDLHSLTASDGSFRFRNVPAGPYFLTAAGGVAELRSGAHFGSLPLRLPLGSIGAHVPIVGSPRPRVAVANDASVAGRITTEHGEPLAGAELSVRARTGHREVRAGVRSDARGAFLVESLPAASYRLDADPPDGFRPLRATLRVPASLRVRRDLVATSR
jgi:arylsulfatase A